MYQRTDTINRVEFLLPGRSYKFRVDYGGMQYWSGEVEIMVNEENEVVLHLDQLALT